MPPTNDNLTVDLVINDGRATVALDQFKGNLASTEIEASRLGTAGSMAFEKLGGGANRSVQPLQLAKGQAQQLSFQINDMATMLATGASPFQIIASQGGQIVQVFGGVNGTIAATRSGLAALGLSLGGLGVFAAVAAAGYAAVKAAESLRAEKERLLKVEEKIAATINKQILDPRRQAGDFAKERALIAERSAFGDRIDGSANSVSRLEALRQEAERALEIERKYNAIDHAQGKKVSDARALAIQADLHRIDELLRNAPNPANGFTADQLAENKKGYEEAAKSVEKGRAMVKNLAETWRDAFGNLIGQQYADNPFVKLYSDGEKAQKSFLDQTKGLSEEMRKQGLAMIEQQNALALFKQRVETAFTSFDLREEANRFRGTGVRDIKGETDEEFRRRVSTGVNLANNSGFFGLRRPDADLNQLTPQAAQQAYSQFLASQVRQMSGLTDFNRDTFTIGAFKFAQQRQDENLSAKDRLNRQFGLLDQFGPTNAREAAVIDQRIIGLSRGVDPKDLTGDQREKIASAFERAAVREEGYQQDAQKARNEQVRLLKILAGEEEGLNKKAAKGGAEAIEIVVKNESDSGVDVKRPSGSDTNQLYGTTF
jgi:hypothetical protein